MRVYSVGAMFKTQYFVVFLLFPFTKGNYNDTIILVMIHLGGLVMAGVFSVLKRRSNEKRHRENKRVGVKIRERMRKKVDRDDFLLAQIDEFREKAQHLQEMLNTKESKAQELQSIVEERESKAEELQQILDERQEKADGITAVVEKQIDILIEKVNAKMQEIEASMGANMNNLSQSVMGQVDNLGRNVNSEMGNLGRALSGEITGIEQKFGGTIEMTKQITEESASEIMSVVDKTNAQMLQSLGELNDQLVALKQDLGDKVHTENVKCFRNIQDLFKVMGEKVDSINELEVEVKSAKTFSVLTMVLAIINTFGFVAIVLYVFGVFGKFM